MIRKLINTFLYGDSKTKGFLWSVLFVTLTSVGLIAAAFISGFYPLFIPAVLLGITDGVLLNKFRLSSVSGDRDISISRSSANNLPKVTDKNLRGVGTVKNAALGEEEKAHTRKTVKDAAAGEEEMSGARKTVKDAAAGEEEMSGTRKTVKDAAAGEEEMSRTRKTVKDVASGEEEKARTRKAVKNADSEKTNRSEENEQRYYKKYTESELKRYFRKYKVKKEHYPILIDRSVTYDISECPAFIWRDRKGVHLFLLEDEPRRVDLKPGTFKEVTCKRNIPANSSTEYRELQKASFVRLVFGKLLPEYKREGYPGHYIEKKTLYGFSEDIYVSAASARVLLEAFELPFMPEGTEIMLREHSSFYVEAKKLMMLWQDGIYSGGEYKTKIKVVLGKLCLADMTYFQFSNELDELVQARLITEEYAEHFRDVRESLKKKQSKH